MWDATVREIDYLANHPKIRPYVGFDGPVTTKITFEKVLVPDVGNVALMSDIGGMFFEKTDEERVFEAHFFFIPGSGGLAIKRIAQTMISEMFTARGACVIKGCPPRDNRAVRLIGVSLGFTKIPNSNFTDALGRLCTIYEIRSDQWDR